MTQDIDYSKLSLIEISQLLTLWECEHKARKRLAFAKWAGAKHPPKEALWDDEIQKAKESLRHAKILL